MAINDKTSEVGTRVAPAPIDLHRVRALIGQARGALLAASVAAGESGADDEPEWEAVGAAVEVLTSALAALDPTEARVAA